MSQLRHLDQRRPRHQRRKRSLKKGDSPSQTDLGVSRRAPRPAPAILAVAIGLLGLICTGSDALAQAGDEETALVFGPRFAAAGRPTRAKLAPGLHVGVWHGISLLTSLGASATWDYFLDRDGADGFQRASLFAGVAFNLDVLVLVPWARIEAGALVNYATGDNEQPQPLQPALRGAIGFDYRPMRNWAFGLEVNAAWALGASSVDAGVDAVGIQIRFSRFFEKNAL